MAIDTCKACNRPTIMVPRYQRYTKTHYKIRGRFCQVHQDKIDAVVKLLGLPDFYHEYLHRIPRSRGEDVDRDDIDAWKAKHAHLEVTNRGSIGADDSSVLTESQSTIGPMRHLRCGICGEEVFIDDHW